MGLFSFVSDIFKAKSERKAATKQYQRERDMMIEQRNYARLLTSADRRYAGSLQKNDRAYARSLLLNDRAYLAQQDARQRSAYSKDRAMLQRMADDRAERSAASRGIDFTRLRDDAVKAGYNPMTALGMAHAYSTEVGYSVNGSPLPRYGAGGGTSGGGAAGGSSAVGSHVPAGVTFGGGGYSANSSPALSAGSFIADALDRGVDSYFNTPPARDNLADALRGALQSDQMAQQVRDASIPSAFGYSLTDVEPFRPTVSMGVPPLRRDQSEVLVPGTSASDGMVAPSSKPIKVFGGDFRPSGRFSDQTAGEERYGEIGGEILGLGSFLYDAGANARMAVERLKGNTIRKFGDKYYSVPPIKKPRGVSTPARYVDYAHSGVTGSRMLSAHKTSGSWADVFYQ